MSASPFILLFAKLAGGLGVFLLGLFTMRQGLTAVSSKHMERAIAALVKTPTRGLVTGIMATLFMQSSAAVTILSMGLVSAGVLQFSETIAIILGTNIGSTLTVGLLSLGVERIGPWLVVIGIVLFLLVAIITRHQKRSKLRGLALSIVGFGTLFVGFGLIGQAMQPIIVSRAIADLLLYAEIHPWLGVVAGTVLTAIITSSSASTALTLTLAKAGALSLSAAITVVFGNNVGTCITAVLASIGGSKPVQRVAATHVLLNVAGVVVFMLFLKPFTNLIVSLSADVSHQVALAHILFNVISSLLALPFTRQIAWLLEKYLPD